MRRKIAVGMLGLALAGCAQSRSSMPGAASRGQPIGMEPVPSISDTINRGTGDPAIVQATLPDPKNPNWSGEFTPPRGPAGTPPGPQVARSGPVQGSASSPDPAGRASAPTSAVLASPSSPPPASAAGLLAGAGMPAPGADPQAAQAPTAPPVQTVPSQQPGMADLEMSRSPGEVPPTAAAAGSPSPDQALPPVEEPRAVGALGRPARGRRGSRRGGSGRRGSKRGGSGRRGSDRCPESVVRPDACPCSGCPGSPWSGCDGRSATGAQSRPDAGDRFTSASQCQGQDHTTTRGGRGGEVCSIVSGCCRSPWRFPAGDSAGASRRSSAHQRIAVAGRSGDESGPDNTEWPGRRALREHGLGPRPDIVPDRRGATGAAV